MKIEYTQVINGTSQYNLEKMPGKFITDAVYIRSPHAAYNGNILIEALPLPRIEFKDWFKAYSKGIPGFTKDPEGKSYLQKLMEIWSLRDVRFPMPFHVRLEEEFYHALTGSLERRILYESAVGVKIQVREKDEEQAYIAVNKKGASNPGFSLIGISGSGKSSSIELLTSHYPQAIRHHMGRERFFIQITYLCVECHTYGNMRAIYEGIGHAIDLALGNITPIYELQLNKKKDTLGEKENVLRRLIECFGIGIIILEEIQNMEFEASSEKSFENFLTLCNDTGIALGLIGTENARKKMFPSARTSNRLGVEIASSHSFTESMDIQKSFVKELFNYQWFNEPVSLTNALAEKIIHNAHGVVGVIVKIYMFMCIDYERAAPNRKPKIDENYVDHISRKYFSRIIELLDTASESESLYFSEIGRLDAMQKQMMTEEKERAIAEALINETDRIIWISNIKSHLVGSTLRFTSKYSEEYLDQVVNNLISEDVFDGKSDEECLHIFSSCLFQLDEKNSKSLRRKEEDDSSTSNSANAIREELVNSKSDLLGD